MIQRTDALVGWLANSRFSLAILAVPTAGALWFMRFWGMDTPDQSLFPHFPVLTIYGSFFALGWMLSRQRELVIRFARLTPQRWIMAGIGIAAILLLGDFERDPGHPRYVAAHVTYALGYGLTMWSLVFLTIGVFQKLCSRTNLFVRYVADSSYWMYLIHLPIVVWSQVAVAELPLHWSLKLAFISTLTIAVSLLTYDLFVRSTFIGGVLNGRRRDRVVTSSVLSSIPQLWRGKRLKPLAKLSAAR
jgi:peptidoglycan/LPS O-acetylase OafA/YrhL